MTPVFNFIHAISPVPEATWAIVSQTFNEIHLPKQQYFAREGQVEKQFGIITRGVVRAFYRNNKGVEYNKHFNVPLSFIGAYSSLVTGNSNQINLQALTDCTILVADYDRFIQFYDQFPEIERLSRRLSELYFVAKEQREIELVLLDAGQRYTIFQKQYPALEQMIPQYHIASYLGVTPTQLSRIRRNLAGK